MPRSSKVSVGERRVNMNPVFPGARRPKAFESRRGVLPCWTVASLILQCNTRGWVKRLGVLSTREKVNG